jgi:hypothetical protein
MNKPKLKKVKSKAKANQGFGKRFLVFWWHHKIFSSFLLLVLLLVAFLYPLITGPLGFFAGDAFKLTGFGGERKYLVILYNENELRPTGGFITSFSVLTLKNGRPQLEFFNSELVELPPQVIEPPDLLLQSPIPCSDKYRGWVFRDSNLSLDFQVNAEKALEFLSYDGRFSDLNFAGVIALDLATVERLVDLYGPLEINGQTLTSTNLFSLLQLEAKDIDFHDVEDWSRRKSGLEPLGKELLGKIFKSPFSWTDLAAEVASLAEQKHLLFYFREPQLSETQKEVEMRGWSGKIKGDNLFSINFANLAGKKSDRFITRDYYSKLVVGRNGQLSEKLTVRLVHNGTENIHSGPYTAFIRIIRPKNTKINSRFGSILGEMEAVEREFGAEFGHYLEVDPGETKELVYEFDLDSTLDTSFDYNFELFKQPGTYAPHYQLTIQGVTDSRFELEGCVNLRNTENVLNCSLRLDQDQQLTLKRSNDITPPLLEWGRLIENQKAELLFSEELKPNLTLEDIEVVDLDQTLKGTTDKLKVTDLEYAERSLILEFTGMTEQIGEFYRIKIAGLSDLEGNYSQRDPFNITIVQLEEGEKGYSCYWEEQILPED